MRFPKGLGWLAPLVLTSLALGSTAHAQSGALTQIPTGPVTQFGLSLGADYDSNEARSSARLAALRNLALEDEAVTPSGDFEIARQVGRTFVFLQGDGGYDFHRLNTIRDTDHVDVTAGALGTYGFCQANAMGTFSRAETDLSELTLGVVNNERETETVSGTATCGRAIGFAPTLTISQSWVGNSALVYQNVNADTFTVNGGLAYRQPALGVLTVFGEYQQATYPDRVFPGVSGSQVYSYHLEAGGVRYERHVGARISLTASVSYTNLSPDISQGSRFSGLTYSFDGSYNLTPRVTLHAAASRATLPSTRPGANFEVSDTYQVDATYLLGTRLSFRLLADRIQTNYQGVFISPEFFTLFNQTTSDIVASGTYQLTRKLSFSLSIGEHFGRSDNPDFDYDSTLVSASTRAVF